MTAEYEEEHFGAKEDEERQRQLLDIIGSMQPRVVLHRSVITEDVSPEEEEDEDIPHFKEEEEQQSPYIEKEDEPEHTEEGEDQPYLKENKICKLPSTRAPLKSEVKGQSEASRGAEPPSSSSCQQRIEDTSQDVRPEHPHVKEEEEDEAITHFKEEKEQLSLYIKKEEPEHFCMKVEGQDPPYIKEKEMEEKIFKPSTGVPLKSEDEGKSETSRGAEPPSSSSCQHMSTEGDGDHWGGSQAEGLLAPLSNSENMLPHTPHNSNDDDESGADMTGHIDNKTSKCSHCGKTFSCKTNLNHHTCIHTCKKPFACSVCGKRFKRKHDLKTHTRTHTGEKPYSCSVCGQSFSQKRGLNIHTRTHTGKEKPFACSFCDRRFDLKAQLTSHMRTHTGEKPFTCSFCGQKFSHNTTLKLHTRIHTGEKPFTCSVCGQTFSRKKSLERHTRTHTGEKRFTCSGCGQKFSYQETIERHKIIHSAEAFARSVFLVPVQLMPAFGLYCQ
ncbi:uncharacterized protein LOC144040577 [Vanacampus margaritifer]